MQETSNVVSKTVNKSAINAGSIFEYKKLEYPRAGLVPCVIKEEKETLEISYQMENLLPYARIRDYGRQDRLRLLLDIAGLKELRKEYAFNISPDNLFFDRNFKAYVMDRDICKEEEEDFFVQYQALTGYTLQKKYDYKDYREGGMELLKKNRFLKPLYDMSEPEEIENYLAEEYETVMTDIQQNKILVNKDAIIRRRVYMILCGVLLLVSCGYIGYYSLVEKPQMTAKLAAEVDYIKGDYISVIEDLSALGISDLSYDQKFILSRAFVNAESLTVEQKENVLKDLPVTGDEKLMEYWIYIGRLNPVEAQNIAMQKSDNELLLYAYMMEKDLTETDTKMTGEEKAAKLKELEDKIAKLAEKYMPTEEE